jgi:ribosomal protein L37E
LTTLPSNYRQQVDAALKRLGATLPCPRCGHTSFRVEPGYLHGHLQSELKNIVISRETRFPMVAVTCSHCGFVAHHTLSSVQSDPRPGFYA